MDPAGLSSFSREATYSNDAIAAAEGTGSPLTAVDMVNNNGEEADKKNVGERGGTSSGTKVDHDKKNSDQGDKQNRRPHQVIIKEIEHLPLYMAVAKGDLNEIRNKEPEALSAPITENMDTPLHVAIQTGSSIHFIRQLVGKLPAESLLHSNRFGNTALHNAAIVGNAEAARIMVPKNKKLTLKKNNFGDTALHRAAAYGNEEIVCYLLSVTPAPSPFDRRAEARLLNYLISAGFYGCAFDVIKDRPETEPYYVPPPRDKKENDGKRTTRIKKYVDSTPLTILARKPEAFESKGQLGFCQRILHYVAVFRRNSAHKNTNTPESGDEENQVKSSETKESEQSTYRKGTYSHRLKKEIRAEDLLALLIEGAMKHPSDAKGLLTPPLETAARVGNHVFIKMIIQTYPSTVLYQNEDWHNIFHISVIHRQEDVFSIFFQMDSMKHLAIGMRDRHNNNILHLVGMHGPSSKISGAALQMQRELQWFKEVEKVVPPIFKEAENREGKAPRDVFTEKHKQLVREGEEWMKNAASSCSVVAALVVTVMFAAAFTLPGGNNDIGVPHFLDDKQFLIFSVSIILGLFSSSISLIMFLGMLTYRYAEDDFLEKLPRRLVIGLVTLFFSLAAMLVAFSASIHILLFRRISWIWIPVDLLALLPVVMFWFMQSRLLYETVKHTYATTIFHKEAHEKNL